MALSIGARLCTADVCLSVVRSVHFIQANCPEWKLVETANLMEYSLS